MLRASELKKVLEMKQALNIPLDEGACFGVTDPSRLRPPWKSLAGRELKAGPKLKEIFVVDGCLHITPVKIPESVWKRKSKIFTTKIDSQPVIVLRGGWNELTTYAGFETEQEAENFKKAVKRYERRRLVERRKVRKNP